MPVNKWVDQTIVVHLHNGILCVAERKKELLPFATVFWLMGTDNGVVIDCETGESSGEKVGQLYLNKRKNKNKKWIKKKKNFY